MFNIFLSQSCVFNECQVQFIFFTSTKCSCSATDVKSDSQARMRNSRGKSLKMGDLDEGNFLDKIFWTLFFFLFSLKLMLLVFGGYFFCSLILHSTVTKYTLLLVVI